MYMYCTVQFIIESGTEIVRHNVSHAKQREGCRGVTTKHKKDWRLLPQMRWCCAVTTWSPHQGFRHKSKSQRNTLNKKTLNVALVWRRRSEAVCQGFTKVREELARESHLKLGKLRMRQLPRIARVRVSVVQELDVSRTCIFSVLDQLLQDTIQRHCTNFNASHWIGRVRDILGCKYWQID